MQEADKLEIKRVIETKIQRASESIEELKELTKPISPENAIGRISRMDAINNRSVNEAALRQTEQSLIKLNKALLDIDLPNFGTCKKCGNEIQLGRLKFRPESVFCMSCVKK
ncbi:MAG: TraR/DksA C4-type zinc finger protein [Bacteroidia bacterium]|nr:TraR/DksA C4-type zinc finger protein [Bacteroidia bacterium]NNJ56301.1 TraR/DksA family transcriptional regulator [Bacteroidia bacterium]